MASAVRVGLVCEKGMPVIVKGRSRVESLHRWQETGQVEIDPTVIREGQAGSGRCTYWIGACAAVNVTLNANGLVADAGVTVVPAKRGLALIRAV